MPERTRSILDADLSHHDVQALNSPDAIAAFFARLGYNTNARTSQTPGNLGITAETTVRAVKKIELIADQVGLFQVYLFELQSVTVAHTRALARAFRNRAGNYLLVLTSDYDHLDFVLLEKYLPAEKGNGLGLGQRQVGIRPRVLTVERHNPGRLYLRVLRRLAWTEVDPFAQYDKLLSAYALADWSEEYFNNRALFSDYYLKERLQDFPEWREDPKPVYLRLRELYQGAPSRFSGKDKGKAILCKELLEPALAALGFQFKWTGRAAGTAEPDYRLYAAGDGKSPLALCLAYAWDRYLDGKDDQRDKETPEENPGAAVVTLLEKGEAPWVVVTNGRIWRLYAQRTHARATNYYEIDLEEVLAQAGPHVPDPAEAFRYFWLVFRSEAFVPAETEREGKKTLLSLLDRLLLESEDYAKELGERLKERVFVQVFPYLAEGFIRYIREGEALEAALSQHRLDKIFQGTLTLLYRILFLLYAEARDLLPVKEVRGYFEMSLTKLKREVAEAAGTIDDQVEDKLKKRYREETYELYDRLGWLFRTVDKGDPALNVPIYNGGLFLSDPDDKEDTAEAEAARFLNAMKVGDRYLARAIDLLARVEDPKRHDLVSIDFKSLGVRHLGSIYEGLLEFKLRIAERKLAVVKEKGREVYTDFSGLDERARERAERLGRVVRKGHVYLENDKQERKATGSYYTPDHIVKYIVEHAVGPVLQEKFEATRPKLREAQQKRRAFFEKQAALRKQGLRPEPESKAEFIGQEVVDELFDIKVLDPAMGSGHFLVDAVDFITDKALDFLNAFPWNPVFAHLNRMREAILQEMEDQGITIDARRLTDVNLLKRHVLKRCIYGVDINPMAVELAKVSLWLDCFTLGAPLSFLDHHLRCGNSLIGVTVEEVREALEGRPGEAVQFDLFGSRFAGLLLATDLMRHVGKLSDVTSKQVEESRFEYRKASDALAPFKRILDVYTSRWFANDGNKKGKAKRQTTSETPALAFLKAPEAEAVISARDKDALEKALNALPSQHRPIADTAFKVACEKRFFHWELEFPEVFYGPRPGTTQKIERLENAGFDAVIGNPPYVSFGLRDASTLQSSEHRYFSFKFSDSAQYKVSLYAIFIDLACKLINFYGRCSLVVPDSFVLGKYFEKVRTNVFGKGQHLRRLLMLSESFWEEGEVGRPVVFVASRSPKTANSITLTLARTLRELEAGSTKIESRVPSTIYTKTPLSRFYFFVSDMQLHLYQKVVNNAVPLAECVKLYSGLIGRHGQSSIVKTANEVEKLGIPASKLIESGRFLDRYEISWNAKYIVHDPKLYKSGYTREYYENPKMFLNQTGDSLKACVDEHGYYCLNNMHIGYALRATRDLYTVAAILNSTFANVFYRFISMELKRAMAQVDIDVLDLFPLPKAVLDLSPHLEKHSVAQAKTLSHLRPVDRLYLLSKTLHDKSSKQHKEQLLLDVDNTVLEVYGVAGPEFRAFQQAVEQPFD